MAEPILIKDNGSTRVTLRHTPMGVELTTYKRDSGGPYGRSFTAEVKAELKLPAIETLIRELEKARDQQKTQEGGGAHA